MSNESLYEEKSILPKQFEEKYLVPYTSLRIPDGSLAEDNDFNFILFMLLKVSTSLIYRCTASLITYKWVLTAAHCLSAKNVAARNIILVGGKANLSLYLLVRSKIPFKETIKDINGTQERRASFFVCHPHFDEGGAPHDVAVVKLKERFNFINPIKLNLDKFKKEKFNCTVVGWGTASYTNFDGLLRYKANLHVTAPHFGCREKKEGPYLCFNFQLLELCVGDAGSPLICNNELYGIASHYGHLKGITMEKSTCHPSTEYYYNSIYYEQHWLTSVIRQEATIVFLSWKVVFVSLLLRILFIKF